MANENSYIGIAMGLDVEDLKSGLAEASKRIGTANAEFKAAASGMEDWQQSTDGLTAKVKQLDTVLAAQKSKLAGLAAEYEKVAAEQGENSTAARNLYIRMKNQEAVVNNTERELKNYKETLKQAEDGTIDLTQVTLKAGKAIKNAGDNAEDAGNKFEGFGNAVKTGLLAVGGLTAGAVTGFLALGESTREVRENFARLDTSFQSAGHSAETASKTYTDLYGVLGDTGRATEAAQQLAKMSKDEADLAANTKILTGVMAEYGDSIPTEGLAEGMAATAAMGEVQGVLADALEWQGINLEDYNAQLATMATEEERAAFIQKTLTDIYADSADAFEERNKSIIEAREAEVELSEATAELGAVAEPVMTELKKGFAEVLKAITDLIKNADFETLKAGIQDAFQTFTNDILPVLINGFKWIIENIKPITAGIVGIGAAFLAWKVVSIVQGIITAFKAWTAATEGLTLAQKLLNLVMKANPIGIIVTLIAGLVTAFITLWNTSDKFRQFWINTWESIKNACSKAWEGIKSAFSQVGSFFSGVANTIVGFFKSIPNKVKSIGSDIVKGLWNGINDMAGWIGKKIKGFGENVLGGIKKFFGIKSPSRLMRDEVGKYLGLGVGEGLIDSIPQVKQQLSKFGNFVTDNLGGVKSGLTLNGGLANSGSYGRGNTVINAGQTIYYNGNLSRKQVRQLEDDNYTSIKMKLKTEGLI